MEFLILSMTFLNFLHKIIVFVYEIFEFSSMKFLLLGMSQLLVKTLLAVSLSALTSLQPFLRD